MLGRFTNAFGLNCTSVQDSGWHWGALALPNIKSNGGSGSSGANLLLHTEHTSRGLRRCPVTVKVLVSLQTSSPAPGMQPASWCSLESCRATGKRSTEHSHADQRQQVTAGTSASWQHGSSHTFRTCAATYKDLVGDAGGIGTMQQSVEGGGSCAEACVFPDAEVRAHLRSWWQTRRCQTPCSLRWSCADPAAVACCSTKPPQPTLPAVVLPRSPTALRPRPGAAHPPICYSRSPAGQICRGRTTTLEQFSSSVLMAFITIFKARSGAISNRAISAVIVLAQNLDFGCALKFFRPM